MSPIILSITIIAYFMILFAISYIAGHKADNEGFFVGNRKSAWYIVAFAMIGSTISGVTFVSVPGMVQASGFSYLQMVLGFIVGQFIIAFVLVPLFYRMNLVSIYEYLENRFGASSYKTGAWFFFISKMLGAAVRLFLVCLTLQLLIFEPFHIPFIINVILTVFIVWLYTFRGRSEIIDMDGCSKNILPGSVGCTLHLLYSFQPASEFQRIGLNDFRQRSLQNVLF